MLYQGVTLGGTSLEKQKRHPTLNDGVVVGAGAKILGAITVGKGARVGAGAVVVRDVPSGATVVGPAGRLIDQHTDDLPALSTHIGERGNDSTVQVLGILAERVQRLESSISDGTLTIPPRSEEAFAHGSGI